MPIWQSPFALQASASRLLQQGRSLHYTPPAGFEGRRSEWVVHSLFLLPKNRFEASSLMSQTELSEKIQQEISAIAEGSGCNLLDSQFKGGVLRLVIDRPDGVTLDDCQTISKQVSALLDIEDFGLGRYVLEVSSPGLDRQFYSDEDYDRFQGCLVRVTWKDAEMTNKRTVVGNLTEYLPSSGEILVTESQSAESYRISLANILVARLEPEI